MRVLLTYGWCRTAYVAAESLAKAGHEVYVCDSTPLSMTRFSRFVRGFDFVPHPFKEPEKYTNELAVIVNRRQIDVLLPVHEDSVSIQMYRDRLPPDLIIASPNLSDLIKVLDKYEIIKVAESAKVSVPQTFAPKCLEDADSMAEQIGFPLIIKTLRGNSGKGVFRVDSLKEFTLKYQEIIKRFNLSSDQLPILQQYIEGSVYGACFLAKNGQIKACFTERYIRCKEGEFGTSVLREPCRLPILEDYVEKMAKELNWTGIGHFDFMVKSDKSEAYLIEMNPRFWGAINLASKNGYDFPNALVTMLTKGEPDIKSFQPISPPVASLWIVGEIIASVAELRNGKLLAPFSCIKNILLPKHPCCYDDLRWCDPIPFLIEFIYYGSLFLSSGGNINPISVEMMQ